MNETILLSNVLQHKFNNVYYCHLKENSFLLLMFSLQLYINTIEHVQPLSYLYYNYYLLLLQDKGYNYVVSTCRLDNLDFNCHHLQDNTLSLTLSFSPFVQSFIASTMSCK